jgi:hypothetical protein
VSLIKKKLQAINQDEEPNAVIDRVLNQILGREATRIIYDHLATSHLLQRDQMAQKFDTLTSVLRDYLGVGAVIVERVMLENLGVDLQQNDNVDLVERSKMLKMV